jgi:small subunit ribosomal protein S3
LKKGFVMKERIFIKKAKEHVGLEEFIRKAVGSAKCGKIDIQYTPLGTRIIIHTTTPGLVIGADGEKIRGIVKQLAEMGIENPQIDTQRIEQPDLDPNIVAQTIASALERQVAAKKLGNMYTERIMAAGAVGCEIVIAGKLAGDRSRKLRFTAGYLKKCGKPAETDVVTGYAVAFTKAGNIGVTVNIMLKHTDKRIRIEKEDSHEEKNDA